MKEGSQIAIFFLPQNEKYPSAKVNRTSKKNATSHLSAGGGEIMLKKVLPTPISSPVPTDSGLAVLVFFPLHSSSFFK